ncbi:TldD/PmbA family protein [Novosphingobium mathurense]|uniref:PmbA protein n=1 Tax=Novosphingobium mathurense TaxID=428990 RepID=A0A1U6GZM4_9SPHN|nr:metallopeptidase TldD-related protein [Novosphingobium mathurense]SLJ88927.1 microcin-processing peptidase 1. Unknown type peptidase. MEROPS family U62 [Novosphingobium mathurense]
MSELLTQSEADLRDAASLAVDLAARRGAKARASVHHEGIAKIAVRNGEVETAERSGSQGLGITVFHDSRQGSASTAGFDRAAIERVVEEAMLIAQHVQPDVDADLPASDRLAHTGPAPELYADSPRSPDMLLDAAQVLDRAANEIAACDNRLRAGECVAVATEGLWALATSDGFCRSVQRSNDARWSVMLAHDEGGSTSAFCQSQERRVDALIPPDVLVGRAADRARQALGARTIGSRRCPVLFDPFTAAKLVGELAGALTGHAQYRRMSFLPDPVGRCVSASHLDLSEDPFEPLGLASGGFDSEGIAGSSRAILRQGAVEGLFLSTFSGRKLGMPSTGNADGFYNLRLTSSAASGDWQAMLEMLGTGLVVTEFQGGKTDPASGNWTQAIKGLWVEDGRVVHAVTDVTLASNMPAMLTGIRAVGLDVERQGAIRTGSILIDDMQVGGTA